MIRVSGLTNKGQATRDRIVVAAADLIYRQGVARTSTLEVEEAAGVSSSQIFHYFGDKRGLVRAVIALQTERILAGQHAMLAGPAPVTGEGGAGHGGPGEGMAALVAWRDGVIAMQSMLGFSGGCPIGSLTSELADVDLDARSDLADGFRRWEAVVGQVLGDMARRGELRSGADPDQLALALLAAFQGGVLLEAGLDAVIERIRQLTDDPAAPSGVSGPG
jgi:TetR/AcrR family transcriptional repressor of nem operon